MKKQLSNIIAINGLMGSGKDLIGKILQLLHNNDYSAKEASDFLIEHGDNGIVRGGYEIKKFADRIKDVVCLLIGCGREQLEDQAYKTEYFYNLKTGKLLHVSELTEDVTVVYSTAEWDRQLCNKNEDFWAQIRVVLQYEGSEIGRDKRGENSWVNSLFAEYRPAKSSGMEKHNLDEDSLPKWIITDLRFKNEFEYIKERGGLLLQVNRWIDKALTKNEAVDLYAEGGVEVFGIDENGVGTLIECAEDFNSFTRFATQKDTTAKHKSEGSLSNNPDFHHIIDNNGTIEELVEKIKLILDQYEY